MGQQTTKAKNVDLAKIRDAVPLTNSGEVLSISLFLLGSNRIFLF